MRTATALIAVAALLAGAPAVQAKGKPDLAGAHAFAKATKRLQAATRAQRDPITTAVQRLVNDPTCAQALSPDSVPAGDAAIAALKLEIIYLFEATVYPLRGAL